ncbi:MAG: hypothetical protein U0L42_11620 [Methanobrevibacter sp.]|uniref:hypothetical protein n=1 Tax=Methanobrevibacter sp. TaxID=66852 RepID=UPI0025E99B3E|nr:hypothetical protein [Methanobrevibacter sp.]MEE0936302.1 hypothetical protein [Methanobrevibacter sp.]
MAQSCKSNTVIQISKCGGIPMFPDELLWNEMCKNYDDDYLETYKRKAEQCYKNLNIKFPWDEQ